MAIYGYSERGIINSLLFAIGNDKTNMFEFIKLLKIPKLIEEEPSGYDILLEQSFSQFGDADLVIILKYNKEQKNKVLFIEGKVKTYLKRNWNIQKQFNEFINDDKKKTSNLFFQLHQKKTLMDNVVKITNNESVIEKRYMTKRSLGKNPIVKEAFDRIKNCEAYYIGLIPSTKNEIEDFSKYVEDNEKYTIVNHTHFLSWSDVKDFCTIKNLDVVLMNFEYNKEQIF